MKENILNTNETDSTKSKNSDSKTPFQRDLIKLRNKVKRFIKKPKFLQPRDENIDGFAVISAFSGLISITCCGCGYISIIPAVVCGVISLIRKPKGNVPALFGLILAIFSIYVAIFCLVYSIIAGSFTTIIGTFAFINYFDKSMI